MGNRSMTIATSRTTQLGPDPAVMAYMERQAIAFEQARSVLLEQFLGQYVWFEDGRVLDADVDHETLVLRIYGDGEPRPLFVRKVVAVEPYAGFLENRRVVQAEDDYGFGSLAGQIVMADDFDEPLEYPI
jgi:hypothetical protein